MKFIPIVNHSLKYNPALDGLRGLAITFVLLFHIWPEYFSFGYVGVDIFFVLSGFLITQIIITKLDSNTFSFKEFYRNRVRRIFPTMLIVVVFTLILGYLFLLPNELSNLGRHAKSSLLFFQNFRLIDEVGYWDKAAELKPFLHFWSLSVEEQFYLFWPFLLFGLYKARFNNLIILTIATISLFLISSLVEVEQFYHSLSRFWELAFGGFIYVISTKINVDKFSNIRYQFLVFTIFLISISLAIGNNEFSLFKTSMIVIATGLLILILIASSQHKLFGSNILVFLGLISFPLYLWHYVFISYVYILNLDMSNYAFGIIFISILFSYLTYRYVELYARKQTSFKFMYKLLGLMIFIGLIGQFFYAKKGLPNRGHLDQKHLLEQQFKKISHRNDNGKVLMQELLGEVPSNDYIKATSKDLNKKFVLAVGDSHAHTSYPGLAQELQKQGIESLLLANSGCAPYMNNVTENKRDEECKKKIRNIHLLLEKVENIENIEKIIFITRAPELKYIEDLFRLYSDRKTKLYYMLENPPFPFSPDVCISRPFGIKKGKECTITLDSYINMHGKYRNFSFKEANKYKNITILDPKESFCNDEYCYSIRDDSVLYSDTNHHSIQGSILQAKELIDKINN